MQEQRRALRSTYEDAVYVPCVPESVILIYVLRQVSGDGHLPAGAADPSSTLDTHFTSLEVYLISYTDSFNLTVSSGTGLLTQEQGSTVKHINWVLDQCIKPGNYNVRFPHPSWGI